MNDVSQPAQTRNFRVNASIITHLIYAQAGTLQKGILEAVQNSHDAKASRIDITLSPQAVTIVDDGHGFASAEEIKVVFEEFSFDHGEGGDRRFGKFGLGRGQLFAFAATTWRSHAFRMDVDIRKNGLNYDLSEGHEDVPGTRIEARLYKALSAVEIYQIVEAVSSMCKFAIVPVYVDGKCVSKSENARKWTNETADAWFALSEDSPELKVYNQGIYVTSYPTRNVGCGGVVCTKPGVNLDLNMARNDIIETRCTVWKRIRETLKASAIVKDKNTARRMTDSDRDYLAMQTADPEHAENFDKPIFTLSNNRSVTLNTLLTKLRKCHPRVLTVADTGSQLADRMMTTNTGVVLTHRTLERFGASTVTEFVETVMARYGQRMSTKYVRELLDCAFDDITKCPSYQTLKTTVLADKDIKPDDLAALKALRAHNGAYQSYAPWRVTNRHHPDGPRLQPRKLLLGRSDHLAAWTDGHSCIVIDEKTLHDAAMTGIAGFMRIANLLVHEYLHDSEDNGSHVHDAAFYEAAHEIFIDGAEELYGFAAGVTATYFASTARHSRRLAAQKDELADQLNRSKMPVIDVEDDAPMRHALAA